MRPGFSLRDQRPDVASDRAKTVPEPAIYEVRAIGVKPPSPVVPGRCVSIEPGISRFPDAQFAHLRSGPSDHPGMTLKTVAPKS